MSSFGENWQKEKFGLDKPPVVRQPGEAPKSEPPATKILSMDEIRAGLSDMAQNGEGAQRAQAYRMLMNMESAVVTLPEPLKEGEIVNRLSRLMKGAGARLTQVAYGQAYPRANDALISGAEMTYPQATEEMRKYAAKITSLKLLNRHFPEAKVHGVPKGFPSGRSLAVKAEWCRGQAVRLLVERDNAERKKAHDEMKQSDTELREATDGPTEAPATDL